MPTRAGSVPASREVSTQLETYPQKSGCEARGAIMLRCSFSFSRLKPKCLIHMGLAAMPRKSSPAGLGGDKGLLATRCPFFPQSYPQNWQSIFRPFQIMHLAAQAQDSHDVVG